jgi:N-acyl amino acid synthase of PEP-CTERM/exosortase system
LFDLAPRSFDSPCADASCSDATPALADILTRYNNSFRTECADTPEMVRIAQAIRYQVYCLERKFENAAEHDDQLECDALDAMAVHSLVLHRPTSDAIGTARLILPRHAAGGLPIQQLLRQNGLRAEDHFPVEMAAEVSRFAISNQFRRRCSEGFSAAEARRERETCSTLPCLGLLQELLRQGVGLGLTHWAAVMEPKLLRRLAALGIHTTSIGPMVSHHGLRQPIYCCLSEMVERLRREQPAHWMVVTDAGSLVPAETKQHHQAERHAA